MNSFFVPKFERMNRIKCKSNRHYKLKRVLAKQLPVPIGDLYDDKEVDIMVDSNL